MEKKSSMMKKEIVRERTKKKKRKKKKGNCISTDSSILFTTLKKVFNIGIFIWILIKWYIFLDSKVSHNFYFINPT